MQLAAERFHSEKNAARHLPPQPLPTGCPRRRPLPAPTAAGHAPCLFPDGRRLVVQPPGGAPARYSFDDVLGEATSQEQLFEGAAEGGPWLHAL